MTVFALSESDKRILNEVLREMKQGRVNKPIENRTPQDLGSPEVYIALPPSEGIPGLSPTGGIGTATGSPAEAGDTPGSAECDLYRILANQTTGTPELRATGKTKTVYNLSEKAITQIWISIRRTKFGLWVVDCPCEVVV